MNILLLQLKRIGDLILTTPAIAAVRAKFSAAHITLVVSPGCGGLLPAISGADEILIAHGNARDLALWTRLAMRQFDYTVDFTRNDRSAFLTLLSRAKHRITSDRVKRRSRWRARSYNEFVDAPMRLLHTVDYHLALLAPLGIRGAPAELELALPADADGNATRILAAATIASDFAIFHPGSARAEKFWDVERWAAAIDYCAGTLQLRCVVTAGASTLERNHVAEIRSRVQHPVLDLAGKVDLLTLAALIRRARLLVTVDSAPMHLAAAMRTPQVVLFGPTNPFHWRPRSSPAVILQAGDDVSLAKFSPEQKPAAMNVISTAQVIDAIQSMLSTPAASLL